MFMVVRLGGGILGLFLTLVAVGVVIEALAVIWPYLVVVMAIVLIVRMAR